MHREELGTMKAVHPEKTPFLYSPHQGIVSGGPVTWHSVGMPVT